VEQLLTATSPLAASCRRDSVQAVSDARLLTGSRLRTARIVSAGTLVLVALGTLAALVTYPGWQLALATVCVVPCPFILWFGLRRWLAPFVPGVPASAYLRSAIPPVLVVALLAVGGWLLSSAPM
jgi:hypothetical protein